MFLQVLQFIILKYSVGTFLRTIKCKLVYKTSIKHLVLKIIVLLILVFVAIELFTFLLRFVCRARERERKSK